MRYSAIQTAVITSVLRAMKSVAMSYMYTIAVTSPSVATPSIIQYDLSLVWSLGSLTSKLLRADRHYSIDHRDPHWYCMGMLKSYARAAQNAVQGVVSRIDSQAMAKTPQRPMTSHTPDEFEKRMTVSPIHPPRGRS